jgi:GTP pyrophosphokinase
MSLQLVKRLLKREHNSASFEKLIDKYYSRFDRRHRMIMQAYCAAEDAFASTYRESGDKYFEHLRAVALILIEYLRVRDHELIVVALLHDIVEDIDGWTYERIAREYTERIADLVWWLTKPSVAHFKNEAERDRHYNQQLHERAPREAVIVKLADRLHNLVTMWDVSAGKRTRKIAETESFYLPLAVREMVLIHEMEAILDELKNGHKPVKRGGAT